VLARLDAGTLDAITPQLSHMTLDLERVLYEESKPIRYVYFPTAGVISMVAVGESGGSKIEVGTVGPEGMLGFAVFLGVSRANGLAFVQVAGEGWRMPVDDFLRATQDHPEFVPVLHRYVHAMFVQASQCTACNQLHSPLERCARWLLMCGDRVDGDSFDLKQEFLGQMLGERRPTVSRVASQLRARGLIAYSRGHVTIVDRPRLEETACRCYAIMRSGFDAV
jgi:CRP-like cAMP-binding protein